MPASGSVVSNSGVEQSFTATYSDANGWANLQWAFLRFNGWGPTLLEAAYYVPGNLLYMRGTDGAFVGGFAPGSNNVITTAAGSLNCAAVTVAKSGADLTVNWGLAAAASLTGANPVSARAVDHDGLETGYQLLQEAIWIIR